MTTQEIDYCNRFIRLCREELVTGLRTSLSDQDILRFVRLDESLPEHVALLAIAVARRRRLMMTHSSEPQS